MSEITYKYSQAPTASGRRRLLVLLDGEIAGIIVPVVGGYRYYPNGDWSSVGNLLPTIEDVKRSLEEDEVTA